MYSIIKRCRYCHTANHDKKPGTKKGKVVMKKGLSGLVLGQHLSQLSRLAWKHKLIILEGINHFCIDHGWRINLLYHKSFLVVVLWILRGIAVQCIKELNKDTYYFSSLPTRSLHFNSKRSFIISQYCSFFLCTYLLSIYFKFDYSYSVFTIQYKVL